MTAVINALAAGIITPHLADAVIRGDAKSIALAGALLFCNVLGAVSAMFGEKA